MGFLENTPQGFMLETHPGPIDPAAANIMTEYMAGLQRSIAPKVEHPYAMAASIAAEKIKEATGRSMPITLRWTVFVDLSTLPGLLGNDAIPSSRSKEAL